MSILRRGYDLPAGRKKCLVAVDDVRACVWQTLKNVPEDIVLVKQGLDLRLREFESDSDRVQRTERELQGLIEEAALE